MNYKLYVFIMWLFSPAVSLLAIFAPAVKVAFPVWLLFRNKWKCQYVIAQSSHESAIWKSDLYKRANNAFGMKPSNAKVYQDGISGMYASYKHVWKSVYDYYDLVTNRMPAEGRALSVTPNTPDFNSLALVGTDTLSKYVNYVTKIFKANGYFGAPFDTYQAAVYLHAKNIGPLIWLVLLVVGVWALIPVGAFLLFRYYRRSHGSKRSYKK